jgi:FkbM family methyltransferase
VTDRPRDLSPGEAQRIVSYAQNAEDVVLARALCPNVRTGCWVDVGAADPFDSSVTAAFSERGWWGVNIDPLPAHHDRLVEHRPRDVNLLAAAGAQAGRAVFWAGTGPLQDGSTMQRARADFYEARNDGFVELEVEVITLASVFEEHLAGHDVDFLKVDAEGSERDVLLGNDWDRFRPRIAVIESILPSRETTQHEWEDVLVDAGYDFVLFDGLNRFYVRRGETELADLLAAPANTTDQATPFTWSERLRIAEEERDAANAELDRVRSSLTYRLTTPLRRIRRLDPRRLEP